MWSFATLAFVGAAAAASATSVTASGHSILESVGTRTKPIGNIQPSFQHKTFAPPRYVRPSNRPIPTNAWWGNLIHASRGNFGNELIEPVWANPFAIQVVPQPLKHTDQLGLHVSYSADHRVKGSPSGNPKDAIKFYYHSFKSDVIISASEFKSSAKFEVTDWDDFGVSTELSAGSGKMTSTLVNGMAFVTAKYENLSPNLMMRHSISTINGVSAKSHFRGENNVVTLGRGKELVLEFESVSQKWVVYADSDVEFIVGSKSVSATKAFTGTIRVARLGPGANPAALLPYAGCVVEGATLLASSDLEYGYEWKTSGDCSNGLLHYGLTHHKQSLSFDNLKVLPALQGESATRGPMYAFVTNPGDTTWRLVESASVPTSFYPSMKLSPELARDYQMQEILKKDIESEWKVDQAGSYYFTGKKLQLYASLCLMAKDPVIGNPELLKTCVKKLRKAMDYFLTNTWTHPMVYDEVYRGVISSQSFAVNDPWIDFGNSMYNDHHYHYGYYIVAGSIQKMLDPTWERLPELELMVETLIRDVANPNAEQDPWFPTFRHFDWYLGHSYSHGISPFADGKDQESTSEDVNLDYGMMLWGLVSKNSNLESLGKLMLKVNTRAIQNYFLMSDDNEVHPEEYKPNKVTGIFFDNKCDYATWFSPHKYAIHGIQMIPVSPITETVRTKQFVKEEWEQVLSKLDLVKNVATVKNTWQSLLFTNYAAVDKKAAMDALKFVPMDDGLTRSWALYMAATRS